MARIIYTAIYRTNCGTLWFINAVLADVNMRGFVAIGTEKAEAIPFDS